MNQERWSVWREVVIALVAVAIAALLRYAFLPYKSADFLDFTRGWYGTIRLQGFAAFRSDFSNYNLPYLYLLYLVARFFPDLPPVIATKLPSLLADFVMAWLAFRIVALKYPHSPVRLFAGFAVLFAPTVILNSAMWGQADALYTAALLGCLYLLLQRRSLWAMVLFGLAAAIKAQSVFLLPLVLALASKREIGWRHLLAVPCVMLLALVPGWIAGRPLLDLIMIYPNQAASYESLSMHAPSLLALIPDSGRFYSYFYPVGLIVAAAACAALVLVVYKSGAKLAPSIVVQLAALAVMLTPFLLPKMHERYFYPADVFTILLAFYRPRLLPVAVGMSLISFFAYQPALLNAEPVGLPWLALGVLGLLVILIRDLLLQLYSSPERTPEEVELAL